MFFKFSLAFIGKIKKSRVFLKSSLLAVYHRPLEWFWDIFLGREICSQIWSIIFRKSTKFPIFESQENWIILTLELNSLTQRKGMIIPLNSWATSNPDLCIVWSKSGIGNQKNWRIGSVLQRKSDSNLLNIQYDLFNLQSNN